MSEERALGVVEALTVVTNQCPNGAVRAVAQSALDAIKREGAGALREQALNVLVAIQGWRSPRARQVHASLTEFLEPSEKS
ncbi:MAG: hypothetical protein ACQGVK_17210 [Myxococcota bacterium]